MGLLYFLFLPRHVLGAKYEDTVPQSALQTEWGIYSLH